MKRIALVLGSSEFADREFNPLPGAEPDCEAVGNIFSRAGFEVHRFVGAGNCQSNLIVQKVEQDLPGILTPGDLLVVYAALHGFELSGLQILICPGARWSDVRNLRTVDAVPVPWLKEKTAQPGVRRLFIFDACRTALLRGGRGVPVGKDEVLFRRSTTRDHAGIPGSDYVDDPDESPLTFLYACGRETQAGELDDARRGLFSRAFEVVASEDLNAGRGLQVDADLKKRIKARMSLIWRHAGNQGVSPQRPELDGDPVLLVEGRHTPAAPQRPAAPVVPSPGQGPTPPVSPSGPSAPPTQAGTSASESVFSRVRRKAAQRAEELRLQEEAKQEALRQEEAERRRQVEAREEAKRQRRRRFEELRPEYLRLADDPHVTAEELAEAWQSLCHESGITDAPSWPQDLAWGEKGPRVVLRMGPKDAHPFENSLGMRFVPVPVSSDGATIILASIWPTRWQDYAAYAEANKDVGDTWRQPEWEGVLVTPGPTHPVVCVNWDETGAFAAWLTRIEREKGLIPKDASYRLPNDAEWSWMVGIGEAEEKAGANRSPQEKDEKIEDGTHPFAYPWGPDWPPPPGSGNYADASAQAAFPSFKVIDGYDDGFATTSPVGAFRRNQLGLHDLGGNVWEWCEDQYSLDHSVRVLRGGSWYSRDSTNLLSSCRNHGTPVSRCDFYGFRVVLVGGTAG